MPLVQDWDGFTVAAHDFIDGGNRIVSLGRYSGTNKATGKAFDADFAHVWTVGDGKVTQFYQYVDSAIVQDALKP